jgi:hypothetical protein
LSRFGVDGVGPADPCAAPQVHGMLIFGKPKILVDISYIAPQAHGIVNVALHRKYSPGIVFIFSKGRKDLYHV